ncbi:MAG: hypothetical protein KGM47_18055 [Acidobacteriota bacterium]|nr:hypothetical protein [Acidobacteriota bacterium]
MTGCRSFSATCQDCERRILIIRLSATLPRPSPAALEQTKAEIEAFLDSCPGAVLFEEGAELLDIADSNCRISVEFGKLLLETWDSRRSILRRVEEIAFRDKGRLGLFVRRRGGRETGVIELRAPAGPTPVPRAEARSRLRLEISAYFKKNFPEWRLERVSNRSDREHSFSAWYTRGLARQGRKAWAFLALGDSESPAAADSALAYGLNWFGWLRDVETGSVVSSLKLFLPPAAIPLNAARAAYLNPDAGKIEIFPWPAASASERVLPGEFGNIETHLALRRDAGPWIERCQDLLLSWFEKSLGSLDVVPDSAANALSFRLFGLEVARMEGQIAPALLWGVEGNRKVFREEERGEFLQFMQRVLESRRSGGPAGSEYFCLQPERWLESMLIRDLSKLDPELMRSPVYPQVPAFSGIDRGVVDILGISKAGRLAVIELKLHEDVTLPLQGLDYWMRVKQLNDRGQFHASGYFPGVVISPLPPVLYLVAPAFRFHPANERIVRYFDPSLEIIHAGINQQWREGIKVLFRRNVRRE